VSNTADVPTVTDNLYAQGTISSNLLGIAYEPSSNAEVANGELTFGGTDSTKFEDIFLLVPILSDIICQVHWHTQYRSAYYHLPSLAGK
jgi:hypothetical protein